jgi:hypothetical protein
MVYLNNLMIMLLKMKLMAIITTVRNNVVSAVANGTVCLYRLNHSENLTTYYLTNWWQDYLNKVAGRNIFCR